MAGTERAFLATPIPTAGARVIATPFQFWASGEDNLRIVSVNARAGVTLSMQARFLTPDGTITAATWTHTPASDRTFRSDVFPLGVGAVLNLNVFASAGSPMVGDTFVIVQLIRGFTGATIVLGTLLQGYVTANQALGWPGSPIQTSVDGGGRYRTIAGTTPAAGNELSETVPTGARWELLSIQFGFTTNATVANRHVTMRFNSGAGIYAQTLSTSVQTASQAASYCFSANLPISTNAAWPLFQAPLPVTLMLLPGHAIGTLTDGLQAGDTYLSPLYEVREWLEVS